MKKITNELTNKMDKIAVITALKMSMASLIAFIVYHFLGDIEYGYWAIVTIAAITQAGLTNTLTKGLMRTIGTLMGAILGFGLALVAHGNEYVVLALFFIMVVISSYFAIQPTNFSYAGIITGLTLVIVLSSSLVTGDLFGMAVLRSLEVLLGIVSIFIINFTIWFLLPKQEKQAYIVSKFKALSADFPKLVTEKKYVFAAIKIALACLFTLAVWLYLRQPGGFWATVSCLLVMEESIQITQDKAILRFIAHVFAAAFGGLCAYFLTGYEWWPLIPLIISFTICGYIIGMQKRFSSLGNTIGIALAIMLLSSLPHASELSVILWRFVNVIFGILVASIVSRFLMNGKMHGNMREENKVGAH